MTESVKPRVVGIWSGEHRAWWRDEGRGYTTDPVNAGFYSPASARAWTGHCGPEKQIEIRPHPIYDEHARVVDRMTEMPDRIIANELPARAEGRS